jgi:hypothetical protein
MKYSKISQIQGINQGTGGYSIGANLVGFVYSIPIGIEDLFDNPLCFLQKTMNIKTLSAINEFYPSFKEIRELVDWEFVAEKLPSIGEKLEPVTWSKGYDLVCSEALKGTAIEKGTTNESFDFVDNYKLSRKNCILVENFAATNNEGKMILFTLFELPDGTIKMVNHNTKKGI